MSASVHWPYDSRRAGARVLTSRIGGHWSKQTRPAEIPQARAAGIEAGSPGPGSRQSGRTAYAHLSPNTDTDKPSMNSFRGIAPTDCHLTKLSSPVTGFSSKIATSQRERSTGDLAPLHRLAYEAADGGLLSPELFASTRRVKGVKKLGVRLGNWLTAEEAALLAGGLNRTR